MARAARILTILLPAAAALALGAATLSILRSNQPVAAVAAQDRGAATPKPERVAGLGAVEPAGRDVAVATPVAGVVAEVVVEPGDVVRRGDMLFRMDDRVAAAVVGQRRWDLAIAEARLRQTLARVPLLAADLEAARSALAGAEAERDEAQDQLRIGTELIRDRTIPEREFTRRSNALRVSEAVAAEVRARLLRTEGDLAQIDPARDGASLAIDRATVEQARAALTLAETELDRLSVRAPRDGTVLTVDIRAGEFTGQDGATAAVTLGLLDPLHVRVDIDEADLPRFREGAPAYAARRGAGDERIALRFIKAEPVVAPKRNLSGEAGERVDTRVLQVLYEVIDVGADLRPGQALDVVIEVGAPLLAAGG